MSNIQLQDKYSKKIHTLSSVLEMELNNTSYYAGRTESTEEKLTNCKNMLESLIEILVEAEVLSDTHIQKLVGSQYEIRYDMEDY